MIKLEVNLPVNNKRIHCRITISIASSITNDKFFTDTNITNSNANTNTNTKIILILILLIKTTIMIIMICTIVNKITQNIKIFF